MKCVIFPVIESNDVLGYLCLCETGKELARFDYQFIQTVLPVLSIYLMRRMMHAQLRIDTKNDFMRLIMSQETISTRELQMQCELYQFDYNCLRICSVVQLTGYEGKSLGRRKEIIDTAYELAAQYLNKNHCNCYKLTFQNNLILFFLLADEADSAQELDKVAEHTTNILAQLSAQDIVCRGGIGKAYKGVETIRLSLRQAFEAIRLGQHLRPDNSFFSYRHDQSYHILAKSLTRRQAQEICDETLGRLSRYDAQTGQTLCDTLRVFLKNRLSTTETAKELFLHRNTMFYRLAKIREILGRDPRDMDVSFGLMTALYARELLQADLLDDQNNMEE